MIEKELQYFFDRFMIAVSKRHKQKMHYVPLKITFHMSAPIALTHPWMHFDGLIGHLLLVDALQDDYFILPRKFPFSRLLKHVELPPFPIKETAKMYHASVSIFDTDRKGLEILYKKFEDRWAGGKKKIQKGSGYFRDYMMQHIYMPTRTVIFYVNGDYEILHRLCTIIIGLGDNTRVGWGAVKNFEIQETIQDYSIIAQGIAMRPIPQQLLKSSSDMVALGWKPPYWAPENVDLCAPPGAKVELKDEFNVA